MKFDDETTAVLNAWANWCKALRRITEPNGVLSLLVAERHLWAQILSVPSGAIAASVFGDTIVSCVDTLIRMSDQQEKDNSQGMAAIMITSMAQAGARYILRRLPNVDSTRAMEHVHTLILGENQ